VSTAERIRLIVAVLGLIVLLVGPFVTHYVRALGKVQCTVDFWYPQRVGFRPSGSVAEERRLQVTFSNRKDVSVTVSEMRVEFFKDGQSLADWTRPHMDFVDEHDRKSPVGPVNILPQLHEQRMISVTPGRADIVRELQKADRAVFVASIDGVGDKRVELTPPW
jgi:hypothetical protein